MTAERKSFERRLFFWVSFAWVLISGTTMLVLHAAKVEVVSFWPIFSGILGYLGSLGVANYMTTPKGTDNGE
jgi:hypothetical protein